MHVRGIYDAEAHGSHFDTVKVNLSSFPGTNNKALASSSVFALPKAPVALAVPFSTAYNECAGCVHPSSLAPPYRNRGEALSCDAFLKPAARANGVVRRVARHAQHFQERRARVQC